MSIWSRLKLVWRSIFYRKIEAMEDPSKLLPTVVNDMQGELIEAKRQAARCVADEKLLKKQLEKAEDEVEEWDRKAMLAVRAGRDDLAESALERKIGAEALRDQLAAQHGQMAQATKRLQDQLKQMHGKVESAKHKAKLLTARQRAAEIMNRVQGTIGEFKENEAFATFDRMVEKVEHMEATAEAGLEINESFTGQSLDAQLDALRDDHGVSNALSALKARMGVTHEDEDEEIAAEVEEFDFAAMEQELAVESEVGT